MPVRTRTPAPRLTAAERWYRWSFRRAEKQEVHGIRFGILWPDDDERTRVYPKVAAALRLIAEHDPRRMERLRCLVSGIYIDSDVGPLGRWYRRIRLIQLKRSYIGADETTAGHLAATIVHEGAHAWLESRGFTYREHERVQVERICVRNEVAFLRRVPGEGDQVEHARRRMNPDPARYTDAGFREANRGNLRELGVPPWLIRVLDGIHTLRTARARHT